MRTGVKHHIAFAVAAALLLAGCSSTEDTLTPAAGANAGSETQAAALPVTGKEVAGEAGTIRFTPIIGAPIEAITPLSRRLAREAAARGIAVRGSGEEGGDHVLKGYFSSISDGEETTIVYVWDVLDPAGNRLSRIQGQEQVPGSAADPWAVVPAEAMERIAVRTLDDYQKFLAGRQG